MKTFKIYIFILIFINGLNASGKGSADLENNLDSYLTRAIEFNPQLKAFQFRYDAAMDRIPQAASLPDPMFQVTSFVESVQTKTGPQENAFMLTQRIPWFGKLSNREDAASANAEALWYAYQNQQLLLARKVSLQFYEYAYTGEAIKLTQENLDLLKQLEPIVEEKVKSGANINSLLRIKVEIGKVADKLDSFKRHRIAQSAQLKESLAIAENNLLEWPELEAPEIIEFNEFSLFENVQANNPDLLMLQKQIDSANARQEIAKLDSYPDISLGLNYIQIGNPGNSTLSNAGKDPWGITIGLNIPIWREKYSSARHEALANKRAIEKEYENRIHSLQAELRSSIAGLNDANRRIKLYGTELLGLAQQAVENSRTSYKTGSSSILEFIDSERSLLELQLLYWRAASDAWKQRITIQTLANQPLGGTFNVTK